MRRTSVRRAVSRFGVVAAALAMTGTLAVPSANAQDTTEPAPTATEQPTEQPPPPAATTPVDVPPTTPVETPTEQPTTPPTEPVPTTPVEPVPSTENPPVQPPEPTPPVVIPVPGAQEPVPNKPAPAAQTTTAAIKADVSVSVTFDKTRITPSDTVGVTLKLTNKSAVPANGVRLDYSGKLVPSREISPFLRPWGEGIGAGATRTINLTARVDDVENGKVDLTFTAIVPDGDANPADNTATASAEVDVAPTGHFGGLVYLDSDSDGVPDPNEGSQSVLVRVKGADGSTVERYPGPNGRFDFLDLPKGRYTVSYTGTDSRMRITGVTGSATEALYISGDAYADIRVRVWVDTTTSLTAQLTFDKTRYTAGAAVKATLILTNRHPRALTGLSLACHPQGLGTSAAWGDLRPGTGGVTLAGNSTVAYTIEDIVPADAANTGYVVADCDIATQQEPTIMVSVLAEAQVDGVLGGGSGLIYLVEDGENWLLPDVTVRLRDRATGRIVATTTSDEDGNVNFSGVPVGVYAILADGPIRFDTPLGSPLLFPITAPSGGRLYLPVVLDWEHEGQYPDVQADVRLDKAEYLTSDEVRATITIRNNGDAPATGVRVAFEQATAVSLRVVDRGGLPVEQGITLAPGETREFVVTGFANPAASAPVVVEGTVAVDGADYDRSNNAFRANATVTYATGDYTGVVYLDLDGDRVVDPGEGLPNVMVTASASAGNWFMDRMTDSEGRFSFAGVPATRYAVIYGAPGDDVEIVGESGQGNKDYVVVTSAGYDASIRAVQVLNKQLDASVTFDRATYHPGDTAQFTFTFTNKSSKELTGVGVRGMRADGDFQAQSHWEPIGPGQPGLTLAPGATKTVTVTGTIPARLGRVLIGVMVVADGYSTSTGTVDISATAEVVAVPGQPVDSGAVTPGTKQPAVQGGVTPRGTSGTTGGGLADTGASVIGLGWFGFVALVLGAGAVLSTRRRQHLA
ncbi:LPXTG cell wall anchor domain-containing protein [Actinokineospora globicatena]|uniref:Uncharacterized protein n=1 Tax=Actinokineospora globicatena TaxID=103729 RepID=A0A9W6QNS6_9PSEU|nr:LPXTG cell wall anchor domain-containing protein [Actinokineospora globicatena]GLW91934.1 hypothetical protein Aglo03_27500 [Actinokineospora globicatena]